MTTGLYKAELIHRRAPWKTRESVELATLEWVDWFNHHQLMEPLGYIHPPKLRQTTIGNPAILLQCCYQLKPGSLHDSRGGSLCEQRSREITYKNIRCLMYI